MDTEEFIKVWDRTRSGIDSFDKYIADVRRFYLTVLFAIVALAPAFAKDQPPAVISGLALVIGFVLVLFTIVFWELDTYYKGFLSVAAWTGRRLERKLTLVTNHEGLTAELTAFANQGAIGGWMFHLMYLVPLVLAYIAFGWGAWTTFTDWHVGLRFAIIIGLLLVVFGAAYSFMELADTKAKKFLKEHKHDTEPDPTVPVAQAAMSLPNRLHSTLVKAWKGLKRP